MGRSRGGLTTRIHVLVDALGLPILLKLSGGQAHEGRSANDRLDGLGDGDILLADRACDSDAMRAPWPPVALGPCVKPMPNRKHIPPFRSFCRYRNLVERVFSKPRHFRAVATRYDKPDDSFLASDNLASIPVRLRHDEPVA